MLDEEEFQQLMSPIGTGVTADIREKMYGPVLEEYERMTGFRETNINAIFHHRISIYGPQCSYCGKPLRTPIAKLCGSCMRAVS